MLEYYLLHIEQYFVSMFICISPFPCNHCVITMSCVCFMSNKLFCSVLLKRRFASAEEHISYMYTYIDSLIYNLRSEDSTDVSVYNSMW